MNTIQNYQSSDTAIRYGRTNLSPQQYKKYMQKRRRIIKHNIRAAVLLTAITSIILIVAGSMLKKALEEYDKRNSVMAMNYDAGTQSTYDSYDDDSYDDGSYDDDNNDYDIFSKPFDFESGYNDEIPYQLKEFMDRRPETTDFVMSYPQKHNMEYDIDLSNEVNPGEIPLLIQWDERWGYKQYGDDFFALNGCGPTCLSMVCLGLGGDIKYDPYTVGQIMDSNDYYEYGVGSKWSIMTEGASLIGLDGEEISRDEDVIRNRLENGSPIICSMGEGDFTQSGHFIVLTGIDSEGNITVNDPCSKINSAKSWELSTLIPQIKNLWAFSHN